MVTNFNIQMNKSSHKRLFKPIPELSTAQGIIRWVDLPKALVRGLQRNTYLFLFLSLPRSLLLVAGRILYKTQVCSKDDRSYRNQEGGVRSSVG